MSELKTIDRLDVFYQRRPDERLLVGTLGYRDRRAVFQYDADFLITGLELSPFNLPLGDGVKFGDPDKFEGLFGLFDDSLPDGWGRLLLDRYVEERGVSASQLTPIDRLAFVGPRAIGALSYEPVHDTQPVQHALDLHQLAEETKTVLEDEASAALPELLRLGGSPQGARPKALILLGPDGKTVRSGDVECPPDFRPYLVKFPARSDEQSIAGAVEYAYSLMAREAKIQMPSTRLLAAKGRHKGYFAIERFDQSGSERFHVHTVSGLLHAPPGVSFVSYDHMLKLAWTLTRNAEDVAELFRRAAFNVYAHNRDDHARNFAFMMLADGTWRLAPAYDLTFSKGPGGEHTMTVGGEGRTPTRKHLEDLATKASLKNKEASAILAEVESAIESWPSFCAQAGVPKKTQNEISRQLLRGQG